MSGFFLVKNQSFPVIPVGNQFIRLLKALDTPLRFFRKHLINSIAFDAIRHLSPDLIKLKASVSDHSPQLPTGQNQPYTSSRRRRAAVNSVRFGLLCTMVAVAAVATSASATQIVYKFAGTAAGHLEQSGQANISFTDLNFGLSAYGDTAKAIVDLGKANVIPIFRPMLSASGAFGSVSRGVATPAGSQAALIVGTCTLSCSALPDNLKDGAVTLGSVNNGGVISVGDTVSGSGLQNYKGLSSLKPTSLDTRNISGTSFNLDTGGTVYFKSFSSLNFSAVLAGSSVVAPLLPTPPGSSPPPSGNPPFNFNFGVQGGTPVYVDPAAAIGYDYKLASTKTLITQAIFPTIGNSSYQIYALNDLSSPPLATVQNGGTIDFTTLQGYSKGINGFALRGIDPVAGLDPQNPTVFDTGLVFASDGKVQLTQVPVSVNTPVPEPDSLGLLALGLVILGLGVMGRKRVRN